MTTRKIVYLIFIGLISNTVVNAQTIYFPSNSPITKLVDRLETLNGEFSNTIYTNSGSVGITDVANYFIYQKSNAYDAILSNADNLDVNNYLKLSLAYKDLPNFATYQPDTRASYSLYDKSPFLYQYKKNKNSFTLNPTIAGQILTDRDGHLSYYAGIGINSMINIKNRIGFYIDASYNYEHVPDFFEAKANPYNAVPNVGAFQGDNLKHGYLLVNAHTSVDVVKNYVTATAGYGKHFIGDGYRSLILSDYSAPYPYISLRTNIGKFQYTNYYIKARQQDEKYDLQNQGSNKYIALHYLTANLRPWLNIGFFETVTSSRNGAMDFAYWNPVIFYRAIERELGSPDKMALGITGKAIIKKHLQAYGQFFINEFTAKEFFGNKGYLHNKWGAQLGLKYYNAFGLDNFDLMTELNLVRPYAYQHRTLSNFSHFNMPLAHPLGAGFREYIFGMNTRSRAKMSVDIKAMYYQQALDTAVAENNGSDILKNIRINNGLYGNTLVNGNPTNYFVVQALVGYQILPNFFWEIGGAYRSRSIENSATPNANIYFSTGLRFNMNRRDYFQF